jgi:hypothetical protein
VHEKINFFYNGAQQLRDLYDSIIFVDCYKRSKVQEAVFPLSVPGAVRPCSRQSVSASDLRKKKPVTTMPEQFFFWDNTFLHWSPVMKKWTAANDIQLLQHFPLFSRSGSSGPVLDLESEGRADWPSQCLREPQQGLGEGSWRTSQQRSSLSPVGNDVNTCMSRGHGEKS